MRRSNSQSVLVHKPFGNRAQGERARYPDDTVPAAARKSVCTLDETFPKQIKRSLRPLINNGVGQDVIGKVYSSAGSLSPWPDAFGRRARVVSTSAHIPVKLTAPPKS